MHKRKGFTLVELLVVIAILAILATVSVVGYTAFIERASKSVDEQTVDQMNRIISAGKVENPNLTLADAKALLRENGFDTGYRCNHKGYRLAWLEAEKATVLTENGAVVYPEKFKGRTDHVPFATVFALVNDSAELAVGDKIIIVAKNYNFAIGKNQTETGRVHAAVLKNSSTIEPSAEVEVFTLEQGNAAHTRFLLTTQGYLYLPQDSSSPILKTGDGPDISKSFAIGARSGLAKITGNDTAYNTLRYDADAGIFSCYLAENSMQDIVIYKLVY